MNDELHEYRQMQRWLKGEKPPAQGRTWRRTVHTFAQASVPQGVQERIARRLPNDHDTERVSTWDLVGDGLGLGYVFVKEALPLLVMYVGIISMDSIFSISRLPAADSLTLYGREELAPTTVASLKAIGHAALSVVAIWKGIRLIISCSHL